MKNQVLIRLLVHLLLAFFLANAVNKFFVPDLEADVKRYSLIFQFSGEAPDQYRILPLLPLKALCQWLPFHTAVLAYNFVLGFVCLELFGLFLRKYPIRTQYTFSVLFSGFFIYTLYTGWRPDTLGLLAICLLTALAGWQLPPGILRYAVLTLLIIALAFSRAEIALCYGIFFALHPASQGPLPGPGTADDATLRLRSGHARSPASRLWEKGIWLFLWAGLAVFIQILLSRYLFPSAQYETDKVMFRQNLSLYYVVRNPATWLLLAVCLIWWRPLSTYVRSTYKKNYYFYLICTGYWVLVLVIGRINELRLYLPFLPLLLLMLSSDSINNGKKVSSF